MPFDLAPRPDDMLLVVDIQYDFCPGGRLAVPRGDEVVPAIARLAERFDHVALTQDWHPPGHSSFASSHPGREPFETIQMPYGPQVLWPDHCIQGSRGAAFHPGLDVDRAEVIVRKGFRPEIDSYSTFFENDHKTSTGLAGFLRDREIRRVVLCGLATDFCVSWSAVDARRLGFEVVVVEDATRAIDLDGSLEREKRQMLEAGVQLVNMDQVLAQH
jgi:nicotinamidase/pyrazinamidase